MTEGITPELQEELQTQINAYNNLLAQNDYTGRKVAFEVAKAFKAQFPNIELPSLTQYEAQEMQADEMRARIAEFREQLGQ